MLWVALGTFLVLGALAAQNWLSGGVVYRAWLMNLYKPVEKSERRHVASDPGGPSHAPIMMEAHHRKRWAWLPIAETIGRSERRDLAAKRAHGMGRD